MGNIISNSNAFDDDFLWLFHKSEQVAICLNSNYRIIDLTQNAADLFQGKQKKLIGKPLSTLFSSLGLNLLFQDNQELKIETVDQKLANNALAHKLLSFKWQLKPKTSINHKDIVGYIVYAEENTNFEYLLQIYNVMTGQNINTAKQASNFLSKAFKNYLEKLVSCMPGNIFWLDKNGVYLGCNNNGASFLGLTSSKEIAGLTVEGLKQKAGWLSKYIDHCQIINQKIIATGQPQLNFEEGPLLLPNGKKIYLLTSKVPLYNKKGKIIGIASASFDISDRKRAEKLQKEKDIAEKTAKLMKMFASRIAHEIRTPLAIVGINSDLVQLAVNDPSVKDKSKMMADEGVQNIKYGVSLATHVLENTLFILKTISSNELTSKKFEFLSIVEDVNEALNFYPFLKQEKSLINLQFHKLNDFTYYGDKTLTQHVLFNLLKNALSAIKEAEKGEIIITFDNDNNNNLLRFKDTALGMSKSILSRLLQLFETGKTGNTGLGLTFCDMVMKAYGGDISCHAKKGSYAEFILKFPKIVTD